MLCNLKCSSAVVFSQNQALIIVTKQEVNVTQQLFHYEVPIYQMGFCLFEPQVCVATCFVVRPIRTSLQRTYCFWKQLHVSFAVYLALYWPHMLSSQSALNLTNPNFFSVLVQSVSCQVLYMKMVIGTHQVNNLTTILPLSQTQVRKILHTRHDNIPPMYYNSERKRCFMQTVSAHSCRTCFQFDTSSTRQFFLHLKDTYMQMLA